MRVLVTGGAGTLGSQLLAVAPQRLGDEPVELVATVRAAVPTGADTAGLWHAVELTDAADTRRLLESVRPDLVVHTAYRQDSRADIVDATASVATAAAATGAAVVHLSTDAVFDGEHAPFAEGDEPSPVLDYGRWKLDAERALLEQVPDAAIVRPSLIVRLDPPDRATAAVLDAAAAGERSSYRFFVDEIRTPILVEDLAAELWALVELPRSDRAGIWHVPGAEPISRHELAQRIARHHGADPSVLATASVVDHPTPRARDLTTTSVRRQRLGHSPSPI